MNQTHRVNAVALTALDAAADGALVDLSELDAEGRARIHSVRARRAVGVDLVCKHCQRPMHLHHGPNRDGRGGLWWFQHNPGHGAGCDLAEVARGGESLEHVAAKALTARVHRRLGWDVEPECRSIGGPLVIADLYARHPRPAGHQWNRCIEVQLSPSAAGDLAARSAERREAFGTLTQWLTPDSRTLGDQWGLVVDPTCRQVTDRLYLDPDRGIPMSTPMDLTQVISRTVRDRHTMVMAAVGPPIEWGGPATWIVYPTVVAAARAGTRSTAHSVATARPPIDTIDRDWCDRVPLVRPAARPSPPPQRSARPARPAPSAPFLRSRPPRRAPDRPSSLANPVHCGHSVTSRWEDGHVRCSYCAAVLDEAGAR